MRRADDRAASTVVGAIFVLGVLGIALVYVNAFYVPRQGLTLELQGRDDAEQALLDLSQRLSGEPFPFVQQVPLKPPRAAPPLLDGVVLSPVRISGVLGFHPVGSAVNISYHTAASPAPYYALGSATSSVSLGTLNTTIGGAYLDRVGYSLEGGALMVNRETGTRAVAPPLLQVTTSNNITSVSWRVPIFLGDAGEAGGRDSAQVSFVPGPIARVGQGQLVQNTTISIRTTAIPAWEAALKSVVGPQWESRVTNTTEGVSVIIGPDPCNACEPTVAIDYSAVRYTVGLTSRNSR